jgi:pyruvate ferredoxin oxidoreductase gamma subunit
MYQIRIHGRGGQGVVTAAELIAIAAFKEGRVAQAFPAFGVERTGAPIEAFARIDDKEIRTREQVNHPDILIIQDATLIGTVDLIRGCNKKTIAIVNTNKKKEELALDLPKENIFTVDATKIALECLGKNIVNTTILGAFGKDAKLVSLDSLKEAIKEKFKDKGEEMVNKNIKAIEESYNA